MQKTARLVRVRDPLFSDDLMVLATDGLPLWDGMADVQVRPAFPEEEARWRASRAKAIRHGNIEREDYTWIAFLVALTDLNRRDWNDLDRRRVRPSASHLPARGRGCRAGQTGAA